jgi:hypothetical protein
MPNRPPRPGSLPRAFGKGGCGDPGEAARKFRAVDATGDHVDPLHPKAAHEEAQLEERVGAGHVVGLPALRGHIIRGQHDDGEIGLIGHRIQGRQRPFREGEDTLVPDRHVGDVLQIKGNLLRDR